MNELINFLTSKEILVVYAVIAVACLGYFVVTLIDKNYYKRKQRHNTRELNKLVEQINEKLEEEDLCPVELEEEEQEVSFSQVEEQPVELTVEEIAPAVEEQIVAEEIAPVEEIEEQTEVVEPVLIEETKSEPVYVQQSLEINYEEELKQPLNQLQQVEEVETLEVLENIQPVEESNEVEISKVEVEEPIIEDTEDELIYTDIEPNREEAQEELVRLTETLEKAEEEVQNIELTAYEAEQEENAIISIDELIKKSRELYAENEVTQYEDEGNEPISLADLERRMNEYNQAIEEEETEKPAIVEAIEEIEEVEETPVIEPIAELVTPVIEPIEEATIEPIEETSITEIEEEKPTEKVKLHDFYTIDEVMEDNSYKPLPPAYKQSKKFERSPIISPIYGIERTKTNEEIELENTANYEKLDEEIKKTNEFLMTLKELQKNLDL